MSNLSLSALITNYQQDPDLTAILTGYNQLFNKRRKLGSWPEHLAIREKLMAVNTEYRQVLSTDLGALAGLL